MTDSCSNKDMPFLLVLVVACAVLHLVFSFIGWSNYLTDKHMFRQTQTAISTYYTVKEGFKINYVTPVMGKPWSIPMEFPLYQWIVAAAVIIFKTPLDQTGRFVSLLFFYLSSIPCYYLLRQFSLSLKTILICFCIVLACPLYIFWSRTFLIESLAMFLSLTYLSACTAYIFNQKQYLLIITCIAGILGGLTKITTFGIYIIPAAILFTVLKIKQIKSDGISTLIKNNINSTIFLFIIPIAVNIIWNHFAQVQRTYNIMANEELNSPGVMYPWIFGTVKQRLSLATWRETLHYIAYPILGGKYLFFIFVFLFVFAKKYRLAIIICFLCFLLGPAIFCNLYFVHEYYYYANSIFLLFAAGFSVVAVLERFSKYAFLKFVFLSLLLAMMYLGYFNQYYDKQKTNNDFFRPLTDKIQSFTKQDDIILIFGFDWVPVIPYYSQRKALMDYCGMHGDPEKFEQVLKALKNEHIGAVVFGNQSRQQAAFIKEIILKMNMMPLPIYSDNLADLYVAADIDN